MTNFDNNKLTLGEPRDGGMGMKFYSVDSESGPPYLKIKISKIVFEPSVYNGTGNEPRKNIVLEISEEDAKRIEDLEQLTRIRADISPEKWTSCIRRSDTARMKAKINMHGPRRCEFIGPKGETEPPDTLRNRPATAAVLVRGVYMQRQASGLMVDVVALKYGEQIKVENNYIKMLI